MIRIPYRWTLRTFHKNVLWMLDDIWCGIKNVIRWAPVIWYDADFDWEYLAKVMEYKLRRMAHLEETVGHHVGSKRDAKRMRVCVELLKRLRADEYFDHAGYDDDKWESLHPSRQHWIVQHAAAMQKQDQAYLGQILGKYMMGWWD